jgi:hypothetical protein
MVKEAYTDWCAVHFKVSRYPLLCCPVHVVHAANVKAYESAEANEAMAGLELLGTSKVFQHTSDCAIHEKLYVAPRCLLPPSPNHHR